MIPLLGDVKLKPMNPGDRARDAYHATRKLLVQKAGDLEVPHREIMWLVNELTSYDIVTRLHSDAEYPADNAEYFDERLIHAGPDRIELDSNQKLVDIAVHFSPEDINQFAYSGYIPIVIRPLGILSERYNKLFGGYGLVGRDLVATIDSWHPYPINRMTLADRGIDTAPVDLKIMSDLLRLLHNDFNVMLVNTITIPAYDRPFELAGFEPSYPGASFYGYKVLEKVE